ncbi:MAG: phosphodiesterase [Piscinibacter sp.]|uniref:phosphodiesterase n=1 Tax=Piscinibacter sp. TaxID=1903157 RepID=UPI003D1228FE
MTHLLVQFSDTHIRGPGELAYRRVDTAAHLQAAVQAVLRLPQAPLAVLMTGDLVDDGSAAAYAHLRELLAPLRCPLYLLPGNHDERDLMRQTFPEQAVLQQPAPGGFVQYEVALPGLRLLTLDTVVPGASHGSLCAQRLAWLDAALAREPALPTMVAMHHPPFETHLGWMDRIGLLEGGPELAAVLARHTQVQRVVCGHLHRSAQRRWAGTLVQTAPSTAHQTWLSLAPEGGDGWGREPPGFLVHAWRTGDDLVSHLAFNQPSEGPYRFRE